MLKKVICLTLFGDPHSWVDKAIQNMSGLAKYGWSWKIFTPNKIKDASNVEVIMMTIDDFNELVNQKCGVYPDNYITKEGKPYKYMSDYYPANGLIFEDYLGEYNFWGHANWDVVYGRLDKWITDEFLRDCDIFGNDPDAINGVFSLYRNTPKINRLFMEIPEWKQALSDITKNYITDEWLMTEVVRRLHKEGKIRFKSAWWLENDHQDMHKPPQLRLDSEGNLINTKTNNSTMLFHFSGGKKWPL